MTYYSSPFPIHSTGTTDPRSPLYALLSRFGCCYAENKEWKSLLASVYALHQLYSKYLCGIAAVVDFS